jgi:hypothetical protein
MGHQLAARIPIDVMHHQLVASPLDIAGRSAAHVAQADETDL